MANKIKISVSPCLRVPLLFRMALFIFHFSFFILSCESHDAEPGGPDTTTPGGNITFGIHIAPPTRVSTGADFTGAWEAGDEIGIFAVRHGEPLLPDGSNYINNIKLTYDGNSWHGAAWWPQNDELLDFYAYYPYQESANNPVDISFRVFTDQSETVNHNRSDLLTARADNSGNGYARGATVHLTFNHALAMVQLTIDDQYGPVDIDEDLIVTLQGIQPVVSLDLGGASGPVVTPAATGNEATPITMYRVEQSGGYIYRALVPPQALAQGTSLFRITNSKLQLASPVLAAGIELSGGRAETFTQQIPWSAGFLPESNSYMLKPGGSPVLIPISRANKAADPEHNLGALTDGLGGVTATNFTVELIWSDSPVKAGGVIEEMYPYQRNDEGYVYVKPGIAGNAVIGIRCGTVIKWSWHIWVTETVGYATDAVTGLTWMDRNLGAAGTTWQADGKNGLYYQWGRKDAFPGSDGTNNNQTFYTPVGQTTTLPTTNTYTGLPGLVQSPLAFNTSQRSYVGSLPQEGNDSWGVYSGRKTIYDPCPHGWKTPPVRDINTWGDISDWGPFADFGCLFNGVNGTSALNHFYPACGYRSQTNGVLVGVGTSGYYWSNSCVRFGDLYSGECMTMGTIVMMTAPRIRGFSIRCVAE